MQKKKPTQPSKPTSGNHNKPEIFGFFGSTGSGKTHALREQFESMDKRQTLVWSPKEVDKDGNALDDYAGWLKCARYTNIAEVVIAVRNGLDVVYVPRLDRDRDTEEFDLFCELAMSRTPCTFIPEELHTVTKPNGGTPNWKIANLMGRASGLRIMASSQRPASIDKDFFSGISHAWCGRQNFEDDAKTTAKLVLAKPEQILQLKEREALTRVMG